MSTTAGLVPTRCMRPLQQNGTPVPVSALCGRPASLHNFWLEPDARPLLLHTMNAHQANNCSRSGGRFEQQYSARALQEHQGTGNLFYEAPCSEPATSSVYFQACTHKKRQSSNKHSAFRLRMCCQVPQDPLQQLLLPQGQNRQECSIRHTLQGNGEHT